MKWWFVLFWVSLAWMNSFAAVESVGLSRADSAWIAAHPVIRVGVDRSRAPIEFVGADGKYRGISRDVLDYISRSTGLTFVFETKYKWKEVQNMIADRNLDLLASARPTDERKQVMAFSKPFFEAPTVIAMRKGTRYVETIKDLEGMRVAVVRGNASSELFLKFGVPAKVVYFESYREALMGLSRNQADAMLGNLVIISYEIQSLDAAVRIAAPTNYTTELCVAVRSDWPELLSIVNKALDALPESEMVAYKQRWLNADLVIGVPWLNVFKMVGGVFSAFLIVIVIFIFANRRLGQEIRIRKLAELHAQESEQNYRVLFHNLSQPFAVCNLVRNHQGIADDYQILEANSAFAQLIPSEERQLVGKRRNDIPLIHRNDELFERSVRVAEIGGLDTCEYRAAHVARWVRVSIFSPKRDRFAWIFTDITEEKERLDEITSQRDEMSHFIYTVSHDLKSPIITINSFSRMIEEDVAKGNSQDLHKDVEFIRKSAERLSTLLDSLLEVGRIGRAQLNPKLCNLSDLIIEASGFVKGRLMQTGTVLRKIPEMVFLEVDHDRMIQVLQNLLENAAKYRNPEGDSWVEITMEKRISEWIIVVRDNGIGIPSERISTVFNLFEKVDRSSPGSGIGLALARRIIEMHRGRIWAESLGVGQGTSFCIALPNIRVQSET